MNSRRAALRLLDAVLRTGTPLEAALSTATKGLERSEDRAFAHAIAGHVLRRLGDLDQLIDSATAQPLALDAKARMVLRIALVQALVLKTPAHAVIATCLPLVEGGPKRLVHGVLGTLLRKGATLPDDRGSLPEPVAMRWGSAWGMNVLSAAKQALASPPPTDITLRDAAATQGFCDNLGGTSLAPGHIRLHDNAAIPTLEGFASGEWWVQDLAASLPARLLGNSRGGDALDLCAAPGGKTMQLAAAGWKVTALDLSEKRMRRLIENLERTSLDAEIVVDDVRKWQTDVQFDAILLDAPCSATGIFRRHPDVLHRVRPKDIATLAELQSVLLDRAIGWLKPSGKLVYATCSLEPAEGEQQIEAFLTRHPEIIIDPITADELPAGIPADAQGWVRLLPGMIADQGGLDGFFIARLKHR